MRLIHTSDWHVGKAFRFADDATRAVLRDERLEVISRIGRLAEEHGVSAVLVAGDTYDVTAPSALRHSDDSQGPGVVRICVHGTDSLRDRERVG
jgi:metallophosphoesterase superfamily enzyme